MVPVRKKKRGIAQGSRKVGWKAARKSLSKEERRVARVEKREAKNKRLAQIKRYRHLMEATTDKNQQLLYIGKVTELVYGFPPKPEQLWWLIVEKKDLLLVAKTSFGKSLILQLLPCLIQGAIALIIFLPTIRYKAKLYPKCRYCTWKPCASRIFSCLYYIDGVWPSR